jgi:hypothetical protein
MWTIIILIGAFIIGKFLYDTSQQSSKIKKEGGMRIKYRELIADIMNQDSKIRIFQETSNSITIGVSNIGGTTLFILIQTYGKLTVQWKVDSPIFGKHSMEWDFQEYGDQELMMARIMNDLDKYQRNVMVSKGLL